MTKKVVVLEHLVVVHPHPCFRFTYRLYFGSGRWSSEELAPSTHSPQAAADTGWPTALPWPVHMQWKGSSLPECEAASNM